jgi:hypothetical protein
MKFNGLLFFLVPFVLMVAIFFGVVGVKAHKKSAADQAQQEEVERKEKEDHDAEVAEAASNEQYKSKIFAMVSQGKMDGSIYSVTESTKTVRVSEAEWNGLDVGTKQTLVKLLSEYMRLKTGSDLVYVQSDRNDQELARKGVLGGISINR